MSGNKTTDKKKISMFRVVLAALLLVIALLWGLFLLYFYTTIIRDMETQTLDTLNLCVDEMHSILNEEVGSIQSLAYDIIGNRTLQERMRGTDPLSGVRVDLHAEVSDLPAAFQSRGFLHSVYLLRGDGQTVSWSAAGSYAAEQQRILRVLEGAGDFSSAVEFYLPEEDSPWCYYILNYKSLDNIAPLGKLVLEIDTEKLIPFYLLEPLYDDAGAALFCRDVCLGTSGHYSAGDVTPDVSAHSDATDVTPDASAHSDAADVTTPDVSAHNASGDGYRLARSLDDFPLDLEVSVPEASALAGVWETARLFLLFSLLILILTAAVVVLLYRVYLKRFGELERTLRRMAAGDYDVRLADSSYREISELSDAFNTMADHLDEAFLDAYEKGISLKESESSLLAAQINPHFIFNVLETINMQCRTAGLTDISRNVTSLAQLLRGNIGGKVRQKITLEEELSYVRYYMDLQISRFGDALQFSMDYEDDSLLSCLLPRLTIQPLVENAVVHGLEPRRGLGTVTVRIWEEDRSMYIMVKDDGVGFDADAMDERAGAAAQRAGAMDERADAADEGAGAMAERAGAADEGAALVSSDRSRSGAAADENCRAADGTAPDETRSADGTAPDETRSGSRETDAAALPQTSEADRETHNYVALSNIRERLELLYGDSARLEIRSSPGKGTEVLLILPIDRDAGVPA